VVFNRQLVAQRATRRLEAEQAFRAAGFRLSIYLRDPAGATLVPDDRWLPKHFPEVESGLSFDFDADFQSALVRRPELSLLTIESQQIRLDRTLADNQTLPNLNLVAEASQDIGQRASAINDKGQFELLVGIQSDVPIQRRNALGRIQQANAKLSQVQQKVRLQQDKIAIELRTAHNALALAAQRVEQTEQALIAAFETLQGYRYGFNRGFSDLIQLNLLETQTNEIEILLVDAQSSWFIALSQLQAALGLEPLDQAAIISSLPWSTRIGPGDMPMKSDGDTEALEADWQLHLKPNTGTE
jgi:outer membrane protein TolC